MAGLWCILGMVRDVDARRLAAPQNYVAGRAKLLARSRI